MKKILAMFLLLMLLAAPAYAADWAEGLSPAKPYTNQPEVNLDETIGYMMFSPKTETGSVQGLKTLFIFLPREDVMAANMAVLIEALGTP